MQCLVIIMKYGNEMKCRKIKKGFPKVQINMDTLCILCMMCIKSIYKWRVALVFYL